MTNPITYEASPEELERERIVEWLREQAADVEAERATSASDTGRILATRNAYDEAADAIERGDHLR